MRARRRALSAGGPLPLGVQYQWTNRTLLGMEATLIQVAGTEDVIAGQDDYDVAQCVKRATASDSGLAALWTYSNSAYSAAIRCGDYDSATGRVALGGIWNGYRETRVLDGDGAFLWSSYRFGASSYSPTASKFDELGRLWTFRNSTGITTALNDVDGSLLATRNIGAVLADANDYHACAVVGDGSGDVITASNSQLRRLTYSGGSISVVWSLALGSSYFEFLVGGGNRQMAVVNGQLVIYHRLGKIELRNVTTGALEETITPGVAATFNAISDIHVDSRGDIWILMANGNATQTDWDLFRFAPDWTLRTSRYDDAANAMWTALTTLPVAAASVFITPENRLLIGGYSYYTGASGQFTMVGGILN